LETALKCGQIAVSTPMKHNTDALSTCIVVIVLSNTASQETHTPVSKAKDYQITKYNDQKL